MSSPDENFQRDDTSERIEALREELVDNRDDDEARREDEERDAYEDDVLDHGNGFHPGFGY